jgi:hypothetical protein
METLTIALFGETEKGEYQIPYLCRSLAELSDFFGNPPPATRGLYYAIQAVLFHSDLLFIRVREEGFSTQDYYMGLHILTKQNLLPKVSAICAPGVGTGEILRAFDPVCQIYHSIFITNELDLYDYLTEAA